jgi:chromosome segregation ATPase
MVSAADALRIQLVTNNKLCVLIKALEKELGEKNASLEAASQELDAAHGRISTLEKELGEKNASLEAASQELEAAHGRVTTLEVVEPERHASGKGLTTEVDRLEDDEMMVDEKDVSLQRLQALCLEMTDEKTRLATDLKAVGRRNIESDRTMEEKDVSLQRLQALCLKMTDEKTRLATELECARGLITELEGASKTFLPGPHLLFFSLSDPFPLNSNLLCTLSPCLFDHNPPIQSHHRKPRTNLCG